MLFYYLCTVGEKLHREAYPQGAQSKDADVYKWVTLHSGSPAVCQREHPADHRWRPDEGGDEERVVRSYAVLQWDKEGFDLAKTKPEVAERFDSRWGSSVPAHTQRGEDARHSARLSRRPTSRGTSSPTRVRISRGSPGRASGAPSRAPAARASCRSRRSRSGSADEAEAG